MMDEIELPTVEITYPENVAVYGQDQLGTPGAQGEYPSGTPLGLYNGPGMSIVATSPVHALLPHDVIPLPDPPSLHPWFHYAPPVLRPTPNTRQASTTHRVVRAIANAGGAVVASIDARSTDDSSVNRDAPFALPHLHKSMETLWEIKEYDDFTESTAHEWINTLGFYGQVSVPVAVVVPTFYNIDDQEMYKPDSFANIPEALSGLTSHTSGMFSDTGTPRTLFMNSLGFAW